ncbi:MAG: flavin reductase family protein [Pseudoxanthomonas mexicana]|nr:flavin reductase family protein [Pseudoxanthomonas mexicana]
MSKQRWNTLPPDQARRDLEPGLVVLLSTTHKGERAIMTIGWHMMLGYDLVGAYLWQANRSHALPHASREHVISLPTEGLLETVVRIGNCSSTEQHKFERFGLTALPSREVDAPGIGECHARFECHPRETRITADYPLFVRRIVHAHVASSPRLPHAMHYRGNGRFMVSGHDVSRRRLFRPDMLEQ